MATGGSPLSTAFQNAFSAFNRSSWYSQSAATSNISYLALPKITDRIARSALATAMLCCSWGM